jgi:predicted enzyme related to lactoylglutathione lyase
MSNHPIVHIEIPAKDTKAAGKFYGDLFDWKIESDEMYNYVQFQAEGGPGGGFVDVGQSNAPVEYKTDSLLVYVSTDDIDATLAKAESLGGKILMLKTEIPQVGWWGVFSDPSGNRIGLYTSMRH